VSNIANLWSGEIPDIGGDPAQRAALQEQYAQLAQAAAHQAGAVPQSSMLQSQPNPLAERPPGAVPGNLAKAGWTAQNGANVAVFGPYAPTKVTPDWTDDSDPIAGGAYDQNETVTAFPPNRLNRAPIGGDVFDGYSPHPFPNAATEDVSGSIGGDLEY